MSTVINLPVTLILLAGGEGKRIEGKDKGLLPLHGTPLIELALTKFAPLVEQIVISANRNEEIYRRYSYPVIGDATPHYQGPLAGIAACLARITTEYAFILACDMPRVPPDILPRLFTAIQNHPGARLAVPHDGERLQPLCSLLHRSLQTSLDDALRNDQRKVMQWVNSQNPVVVDCQDIRATFSNLNYPSDFE